ncbi:MAG TPA: hypothetical protein VHJ77_12575 [Vicinamibacterales bacterium]|jgi:hypothetical protein|nr:hypothetical protein [Vicinamibacterales bacterium]
MLMTPRLATVLLWLFVLNLGVAFGAGLYEHRIVLPTWLITSPDGSLHWNAEAALLDATGVRFWAFVTTGPLTLLVLANLWAAWRAAAPLRRWWMSAALLALLDRLLTFAYFIPTMIGLMQTPDSAEAVARATQWSTLNYVRHALVLAAWISALKALTELKTSPTR